MGISKEDILQIARECHIREQRANIATNPPQIDISYWCRADELERFAHRIEKETLLKAADECDEWANAVKNVGTHPHGKRERFAYMNAASAFRIKAEQIGKD